MGLQLTVIPWPDPVIDKRGIDPRSLYFEWCWLPVIGPTAGWVYLRLLTLLDGDVALDLPPGNTVALTELATWMGLGLKQDSTQTRARLLGRIEGFGLARVDGDTIAIRRKLPWLSRGQLDRLPPSLHVVHYQLLRLHEDR